MGEAKSKEERREVHARKIVAAFERFIDAKIEFATDDQTSIQAYELIEGEVRASREDLIDILVTPPPK